MLRRVQLVTDLMGDMLNRGGSFFALEETEYPDSRSYR